MVALDISDDLFEGTVSLEREEGWVRPWRLPFEERELFPSPDDGLMLHSQSPSGVRLRFQTESKNLVLILRIAAEWKEDASALTDDERVTIDLLADGELVQTIPLFADTDRISIDLNATGAVFELWLPQHFPVELRRIEIDEGATLRALPDDRLKWLTYGSSITKCRTAHSPARTWPAIAARRTGLNLTSLGFGGQCHLDPMVGRLMRDMVADVITLKLGINIFGSSSLSSRTYMAAAIGFIKTLREKHPDAPIGVVTSIYADSPEPNAVGLTLGQYREMTRDVVRRLISAGDRHLHIFEGMDLLGEADAKSGMMADAVHPNGDGYELIGTRFAENVLPALTDTLR